MTRAMLARNGVLAAATALLAFAASAPAASAAYQETKYADQHFYQYQTVPGIRHSKVYGNYVAMSSGATACAGQRDYDTDAFFGNYFCYTSASWKYYNNGAGLKLRPVAHDSSGSTGSNIEARESWEG